MMSLCENLGSNLELQLERPGYPLVVRPSFPTTQAQVRTLQAGGCAELPGRDMRACTGLSLPSLGAHPRCAEVPASNCSRAAAGCGL